MKRKLATIVAFCCFALVFAVAFGAGVQAQAQEGAYPNKVKTHIGELTFDHGIPTEQTSEKLYYQMDYHRAVQAYLW